MFGRVCSFCACFIADILCRARRREESKIEYISSLAIPLAIFAAALLILVSKKPYFDDFTAGAKEGIEGAVKLLPTLVALVVGIKMLNASGVSGALASLLSPIFSKIGVPSELLPLLITRPFSGSAANASFYALISEYGPDSFVSLCASVIMGSSDTMVYIIALYFSSVGIKKGRHAFVSAFLVMIFCVFFACFLCRFYFS